MLKTRIILVFTSVTVLLIVLMALTGYRFVYTIYLNQLTEQVTMLSKVLAGQINRTYLEILQIGTLTPATRTYFNNFFAQNRRSGIDETVLLFDRNFNIQVSSDSSIQTGTEHPVLMLNRKEIRELKIGESIASLPFKSGNGIWYLWGFYRLDQEIWMAVRESAGRFEKINDLAGIFWFIGISGTILTVVAGWIIARAISRPIERLVSFSAAIGKGEFSAQLPEHTPGEIGNLARTMGQMRNDLIDLQKEKEEMLARIAHEIRNPLGGMELLANLLREDLAEAKKSTGYVDKILSEIEGLKSLISGYLGYGRPREISSAWVVVPVLFDEIETMVQVDMNRKRIRLARSCNVQQIWFDYFHLRQILINLVVNAAESVENGGEICLFAAESNDRWILAVQDNGAGIKPESIGDIFRPFYTTKKNGTGLGLAISRKLCLENEAVLRVVRNQIGGCTFFVIKQKAAHA